MTKEEKNKFLLNEFKDVVLKQYPSARIKFSVCLGSSAVGLSVGDTEEEAWMLAAEDIINETPF